MFRGNFFKNKLCYFLQVNNPKYDGLVRDFAIHCRLGRLVRSCHNYSYRLPPPPLTKSINTITRGIAISTTGNVGNTIQRSQRYLFVFGDIVHAQFQQTVEYPEILSHHTGWVRTHHCTKVVMVFVWSMVIVTMVVVLAAVMEATIVTGMAWWILQLR